MDIREQANKYAEGKANEAITNAIAEAYIEGYKAGYKDREDKIPMELRTNQVEYVDLGLPSGTLWSTDYERLDGEIQYLTYEKAKTMKLPTKEQWEELYSVCKWRCELKKDKFGCHKYYYAECVGPNGNTLKFIRTGLIEFTGIEVHDRSYFWLEYAKDANNKNSIHLFYNNHLHNTEGYLENCFIGFKLPVRLVK